MQDSLGDRMKAFEDIPKQLLMRRSPVIIRLDGRAFHTFARGVNKPFDDSLSQAMQQTTAALVKEVQNCVLAYTQSDEISLLVVDYAKINTDAWFGNDLQKIVSISASFCTGKFNSIYKHPKGIPAVFDSRAFNIPQNDVGNYFLWRQQDCIRNSVSQAAQAVFSHKQLHKKSTIEMKQMLIDSGKPWENVNPGYQRGWVVEKETTTKVEAAPDFKTNRSFINNKVYIETVSVDSKIVPDEHIEYIKE